MHSYKNPKIDDFKIIDRLALKEKYNIFKYVAPKIHYKSTPY